MKRFPFLLLTLLILIASGKEAIAQTQTSKAAPQESLNEPVIEFEMKGEDVDVVNIRLGEQLITTFHLNGQSKPFLYPLNTPKGFGVTRPWPIDPKLPYREQPCPSGVSNDHPHHQSVWLSHTINGIDFWHGVDGQIIGEEATKVSSSQLDVRNRWVKSDGTVICLEYQRWEFGHSKWKRDAESKTINANWIDVRSSLTSADGPLVLADTKEGFFAIRTHTDLRLKPDAKRGVTDVHGTIRNSEGHIGETVWGKKARWILVQGPVDSNEVFILFCDHPTNFRHPTTWHARPYGLIAANPFGLSDFESAGQDAGEMTFAAGEPFKSRYRIYVGDGTIDADGANELFEAFK